MTLLEVVERLDSLDEDHTIYAVEPWTADSEAIVELEPESGGLPPAARQRGMKYFLEVSIARDVLDDWPNGDEGGPTTQAQCARLIEYAINDA